MVAWLSNQPRESQPKKRLYMTLQFLGGKRPQMEVRRLITPEIVSGWRLNSGASVNSALMTVILQRVCPASLLMQYRKMNSAFSFGSAIGLPQNFVLPKAGYRPHKERSDHSFKQLVAVLGWRRLDLVVIHGHRRVAFWRDVVDLRRRLRTGHNCPDLDLKC
jgi:hypothetical protein